MYVLLLNPFVYFNQDLLQSHMWVDSWYPVLNFVEIFYPPLIVNTCVRRSDRNTLIFNFRIQCPKSLRQAKVQIFWGGHIFFSNLTILKYEMSKIFWDLFKMLWSKYSEYLNFTRILFSKNGAVKSQFILSKFR